jgi:PAS domain S-box-containing protein
MDRERNPSRREIEELRARLLEAEDTLRAIREGEVDAVVVSGPSGDQVFSLFGTESIYRLIVETMKEAAFTVTFDGKMLYCNAQFSQFVRRPAEQIIAHSLEEFISDVDKESVNSLLVAAQKEPLKRRLVFCGGDGTILPAHVSANVLNQPDEKSICIVANDLTELENSTELIQQLRFQQEDLRAANARIAEVLEQMSDCFAAFDREWRYTHVNPAAASAFHMTREQLLGKSLWELWPPAYDLPIGVNFRRSMEERKPLHFECSYPEPVSRWFECRCYPTEEGLATFFSDITDLKQAEEALATAHRQTQNIIDNTPAIVYAFDLEERFVMANTTVAELLNSTPEQMIGKRRHEFMPKEDADWHEANDRKTIEEGRALEFEECSQLKGRSITWLTTKFPLRDAQGRIYAVAGISTDISARKRAEEQLRENEERLRMVLENSRDGINMLDLKTGRYVYMSPAQVKMTGFSAEELIDLSVEDVYERVHPEDRDISVNQQKQLAAGQDPGAPVEYRWRVKSGEYLWFSDSRSAIRDPECKPMALVGIIRDITDRKNFERQLQELNNTLEKQVEERTAELERRALQLRQLMADLTLAEQRERQRLSQVLHDGLQQILVAAKYQLALVPRSQNVAQSANQVEDLITDAIETSRSLSAELSPPILFKEDLVSALEWLVRWMRDQHGLDVDLIARKKIEPFTRAVLILLFQSARELLFNVVKHAGVKKARIEIDRQDGRFQMTIEDEGVGFDMNKFETSEAQRGGIGLLSIRERLPHIGGSMEIDSAPGRGSRFRLIVPFSSIPEAPADKTPPKISVVISPGSQSVPATEGNIRIVLVDDHMVVRQGMASLLRCEPDFQIVGEASDGEAAINLVEQIHPDVVLMDISMPGMNGVQATGIIHEKFPEIRIIGLSMFEKGEQEKDMREAGAVYYLTKSGPSDVLIRTIRTCIKGKQHNIPAS